MGIIAYGNCRNLTINGNTIVIISNGGYVYGIDSSAYKEAFAPSRNNGFNYIIRNNKVLISGTNSMGSGIYLDELIGGIIENNFVSVNSTGGDNYGIALSYSYAHDLPKIFLFQITLFLFLEVIWCMELKIMVQMCKY
ncbi:MAG: hypothetical protein MJ209_06515 [archaeon]|nr:hypothetical protein [archaeon]